MISVVLLLHVLKVIKLKFQKKFEIQIKYIFCLVPVALIDHQQSQSTDLAGPDSFGCSIEGKYFPEGAQVPSNPRKPCELCYCIRNMTSCVMQECTLHVDGCRPIYNKGVCCPVRYACGKY